MKTQEKEIGEIVWRISKRSLSMFDFVMSCNEEPKYSDGYKYLRCDGDDFNPLEYPELYKLLRETKVPLVSSINSATPFIRAGKIEKK